MEKTKQNMTSHETVHSSPGKDIVFKYEHYFTDMFHNKITYSMNSLE